MSLAQGLTVPFVHDAITNEDKVTTLWTNWFNDLTNLVNQYFVTGRDSAGVGATNQKTIPFFQVPVMTTALRDSVNGLTDGLLIYNSDIPSFQGRVGGAWVNIP